MHGLGMWSSHGARRSCISSASRFPCPDIRKVPYTLLNFLCHAIAPMVQLTRSSGVPSISLPASRATGSPRLLSCAVPLAGRAAPARCRELAGVGGQSHRGPSATRSHRQSKRRAEPPIRGPSASALPSLVHASRSQTPSEEERAQAVAGMMPSRELERNLGELCIVIDMRTFLVGSSRRSGRWCRAVGLWRVSRPRRSIVGDEGPHVVRSFRSRGS